MSEFICTQCDTFARFTDKYEDFHGECPVCEEITLWEVAFVADAEGVSF